jgi:hypothetical protein
MSQSSAVTSCMQQNGVSQCSAAAGHHAVAQAASSAEEGAMQEQHLDDGSNAQHALLSQALGNGTEYNSFLVCDETLIAYKNAM